MPEIDVVMTTWNSNGWWFPMVLRSLSQNCPVCHLVVVDRFSTDGTVDVIKSNFPEEKLKLVQSSVDLAYARKAGIENVDTDIFAFVDSDVELSPGWFDRLQPLIAGPDVGAVQGTEEDIYENRESITENEELIPLESLRAGDVLRHGMFNLVRGLTTQTCLKRDAVVGWEPDRSLTSFEDFTLTQHVLSKGYKWIRAKGVSCKHHKYPKPGKSKFSLIHSWYAWNGAGARATGAFSFGMILINSAARVGGAMVRRVHHRISNEQFMLVSLMQISTLEGFLLSRRYLVSHR